MTAAPARAPRGFPFFDHLTLAEADECAALERLYWRGQAQEALL